MKAGMSKFTKLGRWAKAFTVLLLLSICGIAVAAEIDNLSTSDNANTSRWPEAMAPSSVNDSARALEGILARWYHDVSGTQYSTGSANSYALAATRTFASYTTGMEFLFKANFANTGTASLNISSLGAKEIKKHNDQQLDSGDIEANQMVHVVYDGTYFQLIGPSAIAALTGGAGSITTSMLADNSVTAAKMSDNAITTAKLADNAVTGAKIAMGSDVQGDIPYYNGTDYARLAAGASGHVLRTQGSGANPTWTFLGGILQTQISATTGAATTSTTIPQDDTVPLSSEGGQFLSVSITPSSTSNLLRVKVMVNTSKDGGNAYCALYRDSENASAVWGANSGNTATIIGSFFEYVTAVRSTASQTWKVRCGLQSAGTLTLNGVGGARQFGGTVESYIRIDELNQ